jgi:hypothetical protein
MPTTMLVKQRVEATPDLVAETLREHVAAQKPFPFPSGALVMLKPDIVKAVNAVADMPFLVLVAGDAAQALAAYCAIDGNIREMPISEPLLATEPVMPIPPAAPDAV